MRCSSAILWLASAAVFISCGSAARADVLLDYTSLVGLPTVAASADHAFQATDAQALTVTLTDFQTPAAFTSLQIAVTLGDTLIATASVDATHSASVAVPAAAGNYVIHVIGIPDSTQGIGSFGACVALTASPGTCIAADSFSGNIQTPTTASSSGSSQLSTNFTTTAAGTYTVTLTDDAFPAALQTVSALIPDGNTNNVIAAGTPTAVQLSAATNYQLLAFAMADAATNAGLYGIHITDPSGNPVFDRTLPVGELGGSTVVTNAAAQPAALSIADYGYPSTLTSLGVAVTSGGNAALAQLTAAGTTPSFTAPAGVLEVWKYAVAGSQPGVFSVSLAEGAQTLLSNTQVVNPSAGSASSSYAYLVTLPSAGIYNLAVNDFQFPSALQSPPTATVAQNGSVLTENSTGDFTAAQGVAIVLVDAQVGTGGNGIFGVTVAGKAGASPVLLDQTQAVGGVFDTRTVTVGVSGSYDVTLSDLGFPAKFQNLAVVLSQGSQVLGKIYGAGVFSFPVTPGKYVLTFVATPNSSAPVSAENYGLYSVKVASSAPTLTFTSSSASVAAGQAAQLTWNSSSATSCTAAGATGWTGNEPLSGSAAIAISAAVTLTLTCSGDGGSVVKSVAVGITAAPAKSGGGGGAVDLGLLWVLLGLAAVRMIRFRPLEPR